MKPSIEKLQKFFKLEADRGYDNKAVMGGLAGMLDTWVPDARTDNLDEKLIQAIRSRLNDYERLSETSRKEALYGLWNRIKRELGATDNIIDVGTPSIQPDSDKQPTPDVEVPAPGVKESPVHLKAEPPGPQAGEEIPPTKEGPIPPDGSPAALDAAVTVLSRVGPRYANTLERLGIYTLGDMMYHFPRRYDDYSQLKPINRLRYGEEVTIIGSVQRVSSRNIRSGRRKLSEATISDGSGALRVNWFNQPWVTQRLKMGMQVVLSGKVDQYLGRLTMNNPEWESLEQKHLHTNRIVPVYPLTARITQRWLRNLMFKVVTYWAPRVTETLPDTVIENAGPSPATPGSIPNPLSKFLGSAQSCPFPSSI